MVEDKQRQRNEFIYRFFDEILRFLQTIAFPMGQPRFPNVITRDIKHFCNGNGLVTSTSIPFLIGDFDLERERDFLLISVLNMEFKLIFTLRATQILK